jgi:hypothetical protein
LRGGVPPTSPTMPPRMSTVRGADAVRLRLVHVTLVITVAHCGHDSASSSTANNCSGVIVRPTVLRKRNGAWPSTVEHGA